MEAEVMAKLEAFSLSQTEKTGVELVAKDVDIGMEEGNRSLIGKVYGDKKANALGVKSSLMKLWQLRGLLKVVPLAPNTFQFIFNKATDRDGILQGRPWYFDNQVLVLHPWYEQIRWDDPCFHISPLWIQVWQIPIHWISIETGRKIGNLLGKTIKVLISESGDREGKHLKLLVDLDLTKPLARGTTLKFNQLATWISFKYEQLPMFCFYCGCLGHNERVCKHRMHDLDRNTLKKDQFGPWLRASQGRTGDGGNRGSGNYSVRTTRVAGKENGTEMLEPGSLGVAEGPKQMNSGGTTASQDDEQTRLVGTNPQGGRMGLVPYRETVHLEEQQHREEANRESSQEKTPPSFKPEARSDPLLSEFEAAQLAHTNSETHDAPGAQRFPLQDFTNIVGGAGKVPGAARTTSTRGQWKRRARMQGHEPEQKDTQMGEQLSEGMTKRARNTMDQAQPDNQPDCISKKLKNSSQVEIPNLSEVEATSRDWSQSIR